LIKYLKNKEIDYALWDICIQQSTNPLVYATSWYLNTIAPGWDALVLDNYCAVMPLTGKRKHFINYLYQPFFTQQLGIFTTITLTEQDYLLFVKSIPAKYKFIDINLNSGNELLANSLNLKRRKNYVLNLSKPYEKIAKNYNTQTKRNIKKSQKNNLIIQTIPHKQAIDFYRKHKGPLTKGVKTKHYQELDDLLHIALDKKHLLSKAIFNGNNQLLAAALFINYHGRIIFILGTANKYGRDAGAMYALFDHLIFQFANQPYLLDFEGSEIPGIARFFKGFGSEKTAYYKLKLTRLPLLLKILKR